ncbi:Mur ligase middle domain protein [Limosilactobacillus coleohominis 101-4-CHN]|uniref:Lipid II isoglutaminyl synthase (glutamine-hydrolyzing) subunit MurT n=1 Tax=Limosilactobacillus coleohominis 101-4-CHN TaxID=575594 RepID=C7XWR0_9LACO|nr:Mur ligase family protein [Limosilactobacillus coleohominis]EEU30058.1 Mur ligase middle domain protein [Limosilactobacillus coleohominis 101-4-CHN]
MSIQSSFAEFAGRSSYWFLHNVFHGGSSLPGKITLKLDPNILSEFAKKYDLVIITGTNGKTLTTALSVRVLREKYSNVVTNPSGSNMEQGIVTAFITAPRAKKKGLAVLEVDEANVRMVTKHIQPIAIVMTNLFRDQMDRYGEIYTTYDKILAGVKLAPQATIIANGDEQIFNTKDLPNPVIYYGFDNDHQDDLRASANTDGLLCPKCQHILHFHNITYASLGEYFCPHCGFHRPELKYRVTKLGQMTPTSSTFSIDGHEFEIGVGGLYNIYNALAAYSLGRFLGVTPEQIQNAFQADEHVFGRQEIINVDGKEVTLVLVKNPVGLNQVIDMVLTDPEPFSFGFLLNANYADGIDTSWIWDGNFEKLNVPRIAHYFTGGERYKDISTRLRMAGIEHIQEEPDLTKVIDTIKTMPTKHVYLLSSYTAMLQLRKELAERKYIQGGMN